MRIIYSFFIVIFLCSCNHYKQRVIGLQPLADFNKNLIDTISTTIENVYHCKVVIQKKLPLPEFAFTRIKVPRHRADSILRFLKHIKPDSINYILGLTKKDISTTKRDKLGNIKKPVYKYKDWGVFGLGYRPGPSCIVSTYRIKSANHKKFISRLKKICIHEIGHNLGLKHCTSYKCVMSDAAETIKTVDFVELKLCESCLRKIRK